LVVFNFSLTEAERGNTPRSSQLTELGLAGETVHLHHSPVLILEPCPNRVAICGARGQDEPEHGARRRRYRRGGLVLACLFLMDFQDAAGNEKKALESRDQYLSTLALQRCQAQPMVGNSVGMPMAAAH